LLGNVGLAGPPIRKMEALRRRRQRAVAVTSLHRQHDAVKRGEVGELIRRIYGMGETGHGALQRRWRSSALAVVCEPLNDGRGAII
jgi:hypothetical protein